MKPADFSISQLVEDLQGTCKSIQEVLPEGMNEDDLTEKDHEFIDGEIFKCETCDWWYEVGERDAEDNCESCSMEGDDEEDED